MMRGWRLMVAGMLVPLAVAAAEPEADFHRCATDADCTLVEGMCGKAAVNKRYAAPARQFYAAQKTGANKACGDVFWRPNATMSRCRLESCEAVTGN